MGGFYPLAAVVFTNAGLFYFAGGVEGLSVAALLTLGGAQSTLYRVNLKTGAVTALGALGPASSPLVTGLAIQLK
jgi:hypothetical protein